MATLATVHLFSFFLFYSSKVWEGLEFGVSLFFSFFLFFFPLFLASFISRVNFGQRIDFRSLLVYAPSFLFLRSLFYIGPGNKGWDLDLGRERKGVWTWGEEMDRNGFIHRVYMGTGAHNGFLESIG